jgi:HSP20 family molecular chaperone IbpA
MMILRRGRTAQPVGSVIDVEATFELDAGHGRRTTSREPWRPPIEVFECAAELVVRVEIAGLSLGDLDVLVEGDELLVRGARNVMNPSGPRMYHESRIRYGPFAAVVRLPFPVVVADANAEYVDGMLSIHLPRRVAARVPMRERSELQRSESGER